MSALILTIPKDSPFYRHRTEKWPSLTLLPVIPTSVCVTNFISPNQITSNKPIYLSVTLHDVFESSTYIFLVFELFVFDLMVRSLPYILLLLLNFIDAKMESYLTI